MNIKLADSREIISRGVRGLKAVGGITDPSMKLLQDRYRYIFNDIADYTPSLFFFDLIYSKCEINLMNHVIFYSMRYQETSCNLLVILLLLIFSSNLFCQSISLAPNEDGNLNPSLDFSWDYSSRNSGGFFQLKNIGINDTDKEAPGVGLEKSITNLENHISIEFIPFYFSVIEENQFMVDLGFGLNIDWFDIQEVGFQDVILSTVEYRLFFNNDRQIRAIKPSLFTGLEYSVDDFKLNLIGFYSPIFNISLNQEFSSAAEGTTLLDTPITKHVFNSFGYNGWECSISLQWLNQYIPLTLQANWEGFTLTYDYTGIGGAISQNSVYNIMGNMNIFVTLPFIEFNALSPIIGVNISWDANLDLLTNNDWIVERRPLGIMIGISI